MAISLKDNLTSSYFNAAHKLYSKKARPPDCSLC